MNKKLGNVQNWLEVANQDMGKTVEICWLMKEEGAPRKGEEKLAQLCIHWQGTGQSNTDESEIRRKVT
ncbi:hypothetical protein BDZ91DRAFT_751256 [Kalaharituber pfeilii]|nr:hypothetical protein BDZ91DRAFT_751256 [Kalaharituber pfeilii]